MVGVDLRADPGKTVVIVKKLVAEGSAFEPAIPDSPKPYLRGQETVT
jgi:hypothetical protein